MIGLLNDFFTGLQFLTRLHIVKQKEWSAESFGRSVKFFPLVGLVIGSILCSFSLLCTSCFQQWGFVLVNHTYTALLLLVMIVVSGGLTCDGLMDTMDGIFSGRSQERIMEIMKDSRVGANGVMAFSVLILLKYSILLDMPSTMMVKALLVTPVLGKFAMVTAITLFPYARPEGIGKAFAQFTSKKTLLIAFFFTLLIAIIIGGQALWALFAITAFTLLFCRFVTKLLGGVTGDIYGAVNELSEVIALFIMLILA